MQMGAAFLCLDMDMARIATVNYLIGKYAHMVDPLQMDDILLNFGLFADSLPTGSLVPSIKVGGRRLYLPADRFEHGTCREWLYLTEYLEDYIDGDEMASYNLMALLARPADKSSHDDDQRIRLRSRSAVERQARKYKKWMYGPMIWERGLCVMYAYSIIKYIQDLYKNTVFRKDPSVKKRTYNFGWSEVYMRTAESGVYGSGVEDVLESKFHDIAAYLITKQQDMEELQINNK